MTQFTPVVDREELRRLYEQSLSATDKYQSALFEVRRAVPDLLDELDAKDRRIAELERWLRDAEETLRVVRIASIERGQRCDALEAAVRTLHLSSERAPDVRSVPMRLVHESAFVALMRLVS